MQIRSVRSIQSEVFGHDRRRELVRVQDGAVLGRVRVRRIFRRHRPQPDGSRQSKFTRSKPTEQSLFFPLFFFFEGLGRFFYLSKTLLAGKTLVERSLISILIEPS